MKRNLFLAASAVIALASCSKEQQQVISSPDQVTTFRNINAPEGFDFSSTKTVKVIVPAALVMPVKMISLLIIQNADGVNLLKYQVNHSKGLELSLQVASGTKELYLVHEDGTREALKISNNTLTLNSL